MSHNNWETQPREKNGEFAERIFQEVYDFAAKLLAYYSSTNGGEAAEFSKGGSYGELRKITAGNKKVQIHHMPADSVSPFSKWKGPCIIMSVEDHKLTESYGNKGSARAYREQQKKLIEKGKFLEAELQDIISILNILGAKYSKAMKEKLDYDNKLIQGVK